MPVINAIRKAQMLRKEYNPKGNVPFPFEEIFNDENISVIPSSKLEAEIPSLVLGGLYFYEGKGLIVLNDKKSKATQHFISALELGNYFLAGDYITINDLIFDVSLELLDHVDNQTLKRDEEFSKIFTPERFKLMKISRDFAGELLMPKKQVLKAWEVTNQSTVECASLFNVPHSEMSYRLKFLEVVE